MDGVFDYAHPDPVFGRHFEQRILDLHEPVIYDECKYEGNVPQGWGNLTGREMTQRFWLGTMRGCYVGHGETYLDPHDVLWWSEGGVLRGGSPKGTFLDATRMKVGMQ